MINQKFIEKHLYKRSWFSYSLLPFSVLYSSLLILRRRFDYFFNIGTRSNFFILSVGNIVSGGSGKTPTVIFLAKVLAAKYNVVVLSRGYKGKYENKNKIISDKEKIYEEAKFSGDEPYLLAEKLPGIPIIVGKNRVKSLELIKENFPDTKIVILDDSFQYLKIKHDFDILVYNSVGGIGNGFVLPSGILREPITSQKYSDYSIINGNYSLKLESIIKTNFSYADYKISSLTLVDGNILNINSLKDKKTALLSAIGNPKSFEKTILSEGIVFSYHFKYYDHYEYRDENIEELKQKVDKFGIDYILTTEKDFSKLRFISNVLPIVVVNVDFKIRNEEKLLEKIELSYKKALHKKD